MADLIVNKMRYAVKGILFDKDGTLLDFISLWGSWSESLYRHYASQLPAEIAPLSELWGIVHDDAGHVSDYNRSGPLAMGSIHDLVAILAWQGYRLGLSWGDSIRLAWESKAFADREMEQLRPACPLPGIMDLLQQCHEHGLVMGIVTADETAEAIKHMKWTGLYRYFHVILGHDSVERGKPYPDMVEQACLALGLVPQDVAVIGDTNGDMQMGNAAGALVTIGLGSVATAAADQQMLPDAQVIIASYAQIHVETAQ
ncbi:HAD family hydrolase [Paenibacillus guangzhouensis]|uniref:HAD family hydrolase n=1 Tax=Paenibacillus guangzhouensis TaxID=1473112 RepID=UPI001266A385|nr:HAD family hydrolase [Paenibacillus guangzhouensis]